MYSELYELPLSIFAQLLFVSLSLDHRSIEPTYDLPELELLISYLLFHAIRLASRAYAQSSAHTRSVFPVHNHAELQLRMMGVWNEQKG